MLRAAIREIREIRGKKRMSWYKLNMSTYLSRIKASAIGNC
jgi:hypothetical protein